MFHSTRVGIIVLISHFLGAFLNGVLFRKLHSKKDNLAYKLEMPKKNDNLLEDCMLSSIKSILIVGGYIALSYMIISLADSYNLFLPISTLFNQIFGISTDITTNILKGMVEMTCGIQQLSMLNLSENLNIILSTALVSFGGLSIFLQAYTYLASSKIKVKVYLVEKILHTIISVIICNILIVIF
jgi:hypothetical protein